MTTSIEVRRRLPTSSVLGLIATGLELAAFVGFIVSDALKADLLAFTLPYLTFVLLVWAIVQLVVILVIRGPRWAWIAATCGTLLVAEILYVAASLLL